MNHRLLNVLLPWTGIALAGALAFSLPIDAFAQSTYRGCWKIQSATTNPNSYLYTDPGSIVGSWAGAPDNGGVGAYPMTLSVNVPAFVPDGTLLGSGVQPAYNLGAKGPGGYNPEQILFRCSPDAEGTLYEYYATNGDNNYAGGIDVSAQSGIAGTYLTYFNGIVSRVTNLTTGDYLSRYWQARPLTNLDRDSQGWITVKAKNFSTYKLEFFQCTVCRNGATNSTGLWGYTQPVAYAAFVGGATGNVIKGNLAVGADSATNWDGFSGTWPVVISGYSTIYIRRAATCAVTNTTPLVVFPTMTVADLTRGDSRQAPITIRMQCQTATISGMAGMLSGTGANQTALGLLAPPANAQSAVSAGLTTAGTGVTYLLSDGYGADPRVATGVGVALSRPGGGALNFLTNQYVTLGGAAAGWDPALNDAVSDGPANGGITSYTRTINATFKAFAPGSTPVTPGRFDATAQVIVRVQ